MGLESHTAAHDVSIDHLTADDLNRLRSMGAIPPHAHVRVVMPADEYARRKGDGSLPQGPVMQSLDLGPELDRIRALDEDERMAVAIRPFGSVLLRIDDIGNRVHAALGRLLFSIVD